MLNKCNVRFNDNNDREEYSCVISEIVFPLITRWDALSWWQEQLWVGYSYFQVVITKTKFL